MGDALSPEVSVMLELVSMVALACVPAKIAQLVVGSASVDVAHLHAVWSWADKGFEHETVDSPAAALALPVKLSHRVGVAARGQVQKPPLEEPAESVNSVEAFDPAMSGDLVKIFPADNGQPALVGFSRS